MPEPIAGAPGLDVTELRLLADREKYRQDKAAQRARKANERAEAALAPNPNGYVVGPVPAGLSATRKWLRRQHDAYSSREIGVVELTECRRTSSSLADLYRASAEIRKAEAAQRAAAAQERMADTLAAVEHGGTALLMLSRLQDSLADGHRRPLPGRALLAVTTPAVHEGQRPEDDA